MKELIILKGFPNTGKSLALKDQLPPLLGQAAGKQKFTYKDKWVWIIRRSIHESWDWEKVLKKIESSNYEIIILPAWIDDWTRHSKYITRTAEFLIGEYCPSCRIAGVFSTQRENQPEEQLADQRRCAHEIFNFIETIIRL